MRLFDSKAKNIAFLMYRLVNPVFDPLRFANGLYGYSWFIRDLLKYKINDPKAKLVNMNLYPLVHEKTSIMSFDPQFFHQQLWAFSKILDRKPKTHVDVGSSYLFNGYVSKITKVTFIELRPIKTSLKNLKPTRGDILKLPLDDNSVESLSSLCVAGHVGLGRYGDGIDPKGMQKACQELTRVLAKGGYLYFSTTVGKERICFNAHRVLPPSTILKYFKDLKLVSFSVVDDNGEFHDKVNYTDYSNLVYGNGMFMFKK